MTLTELQNALSSLNNYQMDRISDQVKNYMQLNNELLRTRPTFCPICNDENDRFIKKGFLHGKQRYGDKNKSKELDRAQAAVGLPLLQLDPCRIKSPVELENFKRKVEKVALDTALCVVYLGLEKKIDAEELKGIFFNADLTRAEIEHGLTSFDELERDLLSRTTELGRISND